MVATTPAGTTRPHTGLVLLCAFLGFYLLTASGHFYSGDEETLYLVTESLVERHTFALPDDAWVDHAAQGVHGGLYAQYPPGQSLAAVPFYLLGRALAAAFPPDSRGYATRFCVALFGSVVAALTVALLYRLARSLGYRAAPSLGLAAIYGVAMPAWPYSRTFFAEPLTALLLFAAFCALRRGTAPTSPGWLVAAGLAAGAAVATKPHGAIALPILGLYLLRRASRPTGERSGWRPAAARGLRAALWWGAGLAVVAFPYAAFNAAIYGGSLRTGYSQSVVDLTFDTPLLVGLYGLTISPNKGLLWYAPPVLLALAGWWWFARGHVDEAGGWRPPTGQGQLIARGHADEALACLGVALVHLGFYSRHHVWHGDGSWGPRYLTIALPFVALPMVALLDEVGRSRPLAALVALVATAGVAVQLLGVLVNFHWYFLYSNEDARRYSPAASPLLYHARLVARRTSEWYAQTWPPGDTAQLAGGFTRSEGASIDGAQPLFPRWTTGDGQIVLHPADREPTVVKVTFFDHRPPALRREPAQILVDGAPLDAAAVERHDFSGTGEGWTYQFAVPPQAVHGGRATVTLRSAVWNPYRAGQGDRNEDLGVFVHNVEAWTAGRPWQVRDILLIAPMTSPPAEQFRWFNNDEEGGHHLVDHWAWYAAVAGFSRARSATWLAAYTGAAALPLAVGLALGLPTVPRPAVRTPRQPVARRRRHAAAR